MVENSSSIDLVVLRPQIDPPDPNNRASFNDYLANERTLLAWTRTGLGVFAFGCVIAKFGNTASSDGNLTNPFKGMKPVIAGCILAVCGILMLFYGIYRFYRINRQISRRDLSDVSQIRQPVIATVVLLLVLITILVIFIIF